MKNKTFHYFIEHGVDENFKIYSKRLLSFRETSMEDVVSKLKKKTGLCVTCGYWQQTSNWYSNHEDIHGFVGECVMEDGTMLMADFESCSDWETKGEDS